ncbi:MAG: hypothetical protein EPN34_13655 [Burkholderiaceae bacterium]|jgi:phosphoribosylformylglycinamidine synthase|nr:MAG: hypothetical protein EPN34_13655 [Burkholderiaceae bacterium]
MPAPIDSSPAETSAETSAALNLDDIALPDAIQRVLAAQRAEDSKAPPLDPDALESTLLLVDLGRQRDRVQGSLLARVCGQGDRRHRDGAAEPASATDSAALNGALRELRGQHKLLAACARGSGGMLACVAHMAQTGNVGVALNVDLLVTGGDGVSDGRMDSGEVKNWTQQVSGRRAEQTLRALFSEEAGAVLQIRTADRAAVMQVLRDHGLSRCTSFIGKTRPQAAATDQGKGALTIWRDATQIFGATLEQIARADFDLSSSGGQAQSDATAKRKPETREEKIRALKMGL